MHELKTLPAYFTHLITGYKNFEIRNNDRAFQKGDKVMLREYDPSRHNIEDYKYTGRVITAEIGYVTPYKQKEGYVVFSLINQEFKDLKPK